MAASPLCLVSREELQSLALSINPLHYWTVGVTLGFSHKTVRKLDKTHGKGALLMILTQWVEQQGEGDDVRGLLAEKLKKAGLESEWNKLLDDSTSVIRVDDKLLVDIADDVETEEKVETLGLALGFTRAALNRYRETNRQEGRVTSKGTRDMLFDWRQKTDPDKQRKALALALHRAELLQMATEYLPDIKVKIGPTKGTAAAPNRIQAISDRLLADIASAIETPDQVESLGRTLGFNQRELIRYLETNRVECRVTCRGTRDMLYDWRQKVPLGDQRPTLRQALIQSGLVMLADKYLNESSILLDGIQITDNFTAEQCRQRLIHLYKTTLCKVQMKPWDKYSVADVKDIFTVVTMYKKDADGSNLWEQEKVTLQGSIDEIFKTEVNGKLPYRIVVLAAAGKGKTTSVAKMAYDWVNQTKGSAFEHLPLLFTVKLRKANRHMSLAEAIISEYLSGIKDLTPELLHTFIRTNQGLCWLVLDGLDEYSGLGEKKSLESSLGSIVATLNFKDLQECRVLVTCRPHLESYFNQGELPRIYAKMVIEGFGEEQSEGYIDRFFNDEVKSQQVKEYLSHHDVIKELVTTPLFCLMVCCLWANRLLEGINTQTQLFDGVNLFLWQHSKDRGEAVSESKLHEAMYGLGKVAFQGLLKNSNKLIFSTKDFTKVQTALLNGIKLGIVSESVQSQQDSLSDQSEPSSCIEFYHKSAQEHAAGKYLAKQSNKSLMKLKLSKLDFVLRKIRGRVGQYENILRFAGGSDGKTCMRVMQEILSNSSLAKSERFRLLFDCSTEAASLEGGVSSIVQGCIQNGEVFLKSPTVYTIVGLKKLPQELKEEIASVELQNSKLTALLSERLSEGLQSLPKLDHVTVSQPSVIQSLPTFGSISSLKLQDCPESFFEGHGWLNGAGDAEKLEVTFTVSGDVSGLHTERKSESSLHLTQAQMTLYNAVEKTIRVVENLPQDISYKISHLSMEHTHLSVDLTNRLWSCLAAFSLPADLIIKHSSLTFSPEATITLPSIRTLKVTDISADSYRGLVRSLPGLYWICPRRPDDDIRDIALGLREAEGSLSVLRLDGWDAAERRVSSETMRVLCEAVRGITSLREVWLRWLVIDEEDLIRLIEACRTVRAMKWINLYDCGSQRGGRLDAHVARVEHPWGSRTDGIKVWIYYGDLTHHNEAYVPHLQ